MNEALAPNDTSDIPFRPFKRERVFGYAKQSVTCHQCHRGRQTYVMYTKVVLCGAGGEGTAGPHRLRASLQSNMQHSRSHSTAVERRAAASHSVQMRVQHEHNSSGVDAASSRHLPVPDEFAPAFSLQQQHTQHQ